MSLIILRCRRALVVATVVLASCAAPQLFHPQLSVLDKGLGSAEVVARLKQPPLSVHTAAAGGRSFDFQRYHMNNGLQTDLYFLAYERDRLAFWGYVSEFRRQPDADLSQALNGVLREVAAAAKAK